MLTPCNRSTLKMLVDTHGLNAILLALSDIAYGYALESPNAAAEQQHRTDAKRLEATAVWVE